MKISPNDLAICHQITRQGGSNLALVSKGLSTSRQYFFAPAYASMRLVDDMVDEWFLALPSKQRQEERPEYLARIAEWEKHACLAAKGETTDIHFKFKLADHHAKAVFRALSSMLGQSNLGDYPWQAMANAMRHDVQERAIENWQDFEDYGWGATVSPTAVYLFILTCQHDKQTGRYHGYSGQLLMEMAKSIGLFCYLVHIARDLMKDMQKNDQLLTLPRELVKAIDRQDYKAAQGLILPEIMAQAEKQKDLLQKPLEELTSMMSFANKLVFKSLFGLYLNMYNALKDDPALIQDQAFENRIRHQSGLQNS